jgi:hypothetical protein
MTDAEVTTFNRDVSRRAQEVYSQTEKYQQNYRTGMIAARAMREETPPRNGKAA